ARHAEGPPAPALCDPARLQQVVANLLSNADKYSPKGQPVVVRMLFRPDTVEVSVKDYGMGIPEEQQNEIFEPFRRLGNHLTRRTRGCGLGLHIARRLVESMGGQIWLESRPGHGSTFFVSVPVAQVKPSEASLRAVG
ncbi:MAG: ATP-binding protein, partial [Mycobacteriales bacterium]